MRLTKAIVTLLIIFCAETLSAQYYSWGSDAPMKWSEIEGERVQVVYPDTTSALAHRVLSYINAVQGDISHGFYKPALDIPFVMHPENFSSNGLVMWMPKRIEFLSTPATDSYSMLWSKQLVAHEYRHAVQYNNLNNSWIKILSYILGQQGAAVGLAFMPLFALEGDAVLIETQMSTYGRGLQPSFSIEYRALGDEVLNRRNSDKWFCGSYRENIPDHYKLGYQFASYTYEKYDENVWNKAVRYTTRNPYLVFSSSAGIRRYYDTNVETLTRETFAELKELWRPLREVPNSMQIISEVDSADYTTYSHPIALGGGEVLALRSSFDSSSRFVMVDKEGSERVVAKTGSISTRPSYGAGRVWWTEYRRSKLFDERVFSQLCYMDIDEGKPQWVRGIDRVLYAEAIGADDPQHIAYVEYSPDGRYVVVERCGERELRRLGVKFPAEIHGLAWDDVSQKLYIIVTDDSGMWLGVESGDGFEQLHEGRYITIGNLRAKGGELYFGSIASGLDELHSYNIDSGVEHQITRSTYGSFQPSVPKDGYIYATTYNRYGYNLSRQVEEDVVGEIFPAQTPHNMVNPERRSLGLVNIDSVRYGAVDSIHIAEHSPSKRFSKGGHLVNIHSWAPVRFNPFSLFDELNLDVGLGATLITQGLLSSSEGYVSYGYDKTYGSLVSGYLNYTGWGVNLSIGASYGGDRQIYTLFEGVPLPSYSMSKYLSFSTVATLPLYYQRGYITRTLELSTGWSYSNGLVLNLSQLMNSSEVDYKNGLHKLSVGIGHGAYARASYRDFVTPLGYYICANYISNPLNSDFSSLISTYAKVYLPGLLPHNSLILAANYQTSVGGYRIDGYSPLSYMSVYILPQGYTSADIVNNNYFATTLDYQLPVWYPDGGVEGVAYFKRVRLKAGVEYAQFDYADERHQLYSYGGGVVVDANFLRLPSSGTTEVEFSIYKPHDRSLSYEVGLSLPF